MADLLNLENREVVIGAGPAGTVYAASRVAAGFREPVILEKSFRPGGMFRQFTDQFWLNSVNGASLDSTNPGPTRLRPKGGYDDLNYLPNCAYQVVKVCSTEYPSSKLMGETIERNANRLEVITNCDVTVSNPYLSKPEIDVDGTVYRAGRLVDARGLMPNPVPLAEENTSIITGDMFFQAAYGPFGADPVRVALIGFGDMGCIVAESLLGQGPSGRPFNVSEIAVFDQNLPEDSSGNVTKWSWLDRNNRTHARYLGLARHFPQDGVTGVIRPVRKRAEARKLGKLARVDGENFDLVIYCTGYRPAFKGSESAPANFELSSDGGLYRRENNYFVIGTAAGIRYQSPEISKGYARFPKNTDAMFRLLPEAAALAASLPEVS